MYFHLPIFALTCTFNMYSKIPMHVNFSPQIRNVGLFSSADGHHRFVYFGINISWPRLFRVTSYYYSIKLLNFTVLCVFLGGHTLAVHITHRSNFNSSAICRIQSKHFGTGGIIIATLLLLSYDKCSQITISYPVKFN